MKDTNAVKSTSLFELDGNPSLGRALPISLQHLLAMVVGNTLPAIVVANTLGDRISPQTGVYLIQAAMFIAAITTFLQVYTLGPIGARLPVIMGVSFAYIPVIQSIAATDAGLPGILGAQIVGGIVAIFVGLVIGKIRRFFPPMVAGTVVITIGLGLYSVALNYMAGGGNPEINPNYGSFANWGIAFLTLAIVLICNMYAKGIIKLAAILIGIVVGYIVAVALGMVNFDGVANAAWFTLPKFMPAVAAIDGGGLVFPGSAVATMVIMYIVNSVPAVGDLSSTTIGGLDREPTDKELSGGIMANGVGSIIGALIGGLPTATYSQNVGIVAMTKVVSLKVFKITALIILIAGFIPKFGAIMLSIPQAIIGGATVSVFAQITMSGMRLITSDEMSVRNTTIVGLGIALGMGVTSISEAAFASFPDWFNMVFTSSPVILATIVVFFLNLILPKKSIAEEQAEREAREQGE